MVNLKREKVYLFQGNVRQMSARAPARSSSHINVSTLHTYFTTSDYWGMSLENRIDESTFSKGTDYLYDILSSERRLNSLFVSRFSRVPK